MVTFFVGETEYPLNAFWSHYKEDPVTTETFTMTISSNEKELIEIVEKYAECSIYDVSIGQCVMRKDKYRRSMGLMWNLSLVFEKRYVHPNSETFNWVVNNIRSITLTENQFVIEGDVSMFDPTIFNG